MISFCCVVLLCCDSCFVVKQVEQKKVEKKCKKVAMKYKCTLNYLNDPFQPIDYDNFKWIDDTTITGVLLYWGLNFHFFCKC